MKKMMSLMAGLLAFVALAMLPPCQNAATIGGDHLKYIKGYSEIGGKAVLIDDKKHYTPEQIEKTSPYAVIHKLEELNNLL